MKQEILDFCIRKSRRSNFCSLRTPWKRYF